MQYTKIATIRSRIAHTIHIVYCSVSILVGFVSLSLSLLSVFSSFFGFFGKGCDRGSAIIIIHMDNSEYQSV